MSDFGRRIIVPLLALAFVLAFQISINHLSLESRALPQVAIVLLGLVCIYSIVRDLLLWRAGRATEALPDAPLLDRSRIRTGLVALATIIYILSLNPIGFFPATAVFLAVCFMIIGGFSLMVVPYTAAALIVIYLFFDRGLTVLLPGTY